MCTRIISTFARAMLPALCAALLATSYAGAQQSVPATAPNPPGQNDAVAQAYAERRDKMIEDCERNHGIDCAREVDTELRAEAIQRRGHVIHQMRPVGVRSTQGSN